MRAQDRTIVTSLVLLMLIIWLSFLFHRSPRFAGSLLGGVLGVSGAILMFIPLAVYSLIKRVPLLKQRVVIWIPMRTLLSVHIYTALIGSIFVLIHTGHKFDSPLGILLVAMVLLVVLSGFIGRYLMSYINHGLREKQQMLGQLQLEFEQMSNGLSAQKAEQSFLPSVSDGIWNWFPDKSQTEGSVLSFTILASAITDLEYSIAVHGWMTNWFQKWLRIHQLISGILLALLMFHVWSGIYYGLRWFQ